MFDSIKAGLGSLFPKGEGDNPLAAPAAPSRGGKHADSKLSARQHYLRNRAKNRERAREGLPQRAPHGRGENKLRTVLVVPEERKPRSLRDPKVLERQRAKARAAKGTA